MSQEPMPMPAPPPDPQGLLERLLDEAEAQSPPSSASSAPPQQPTAAVNAPPPPSSSPLGALLSDPALLTALPSLMENLTPLLGSLGRGVGSAPNASRPHSIDRHTALLCAIKPYLSPHRRETAETVIRLCRIWDALERSGISLTGLLGSLGGASAPPHEGRDDRVQ
jgi:hypothetical protein